MGLSMGALGVLMAGLFGYFAFMAPGKEIASVGVTVGEPFELSYVSNGEAQRIWLDLTCTSCDPNAVQGNVTAVDAARRSIAETHIERPISGYTHTHEEVGLRHTIWGQPCRKVPARPSGERVTISGKLAPEPAPICRAGPITLNDDIPPPKVTNMRIWVAP